MKKPKKRVGIGSGSWCLGLGSLCSLSDHKGWDKFNMVLILYLTARGISKNSPKIAEIVLGVNKFWHTSFQLILIHSKSFTIR